MAAIGKSDKTALQLEISLLATLIENVTNTLSTVEDFYTGRPEADIPPENMWLEKLVDTSANGIDKALQCWLLNREEWDAARHARGQNKGYSSSKTLARAWLNKDRK